MNLVKKLDENLEKYLLVVLLSSTVILIALQVFMRYVMDASLSWTEELARFLFIWMAYIGISYGVKEKRHIRVDAALLFMPKKVQKVIRIIADVLSIVFCIFIIKQGISVVMNLANFGQTSPALSIPMAYVYLASPAGLSLAIIRLLQNIVETARSLKNANEDDESNLVRSLQSDAS
ncbi:MAG: TRAP transporter small permease [Desulfotomaculum sp.]|nr:TRAP transporter small permease [Desulfotomaculum sp.]